MNKNLKITIRAFIYFTVFSSSLYGISMSLASGNISKGVIWGLLFGTIISVFLSSFLFIGLTLFEKKSFFYSNMPHLLQSKKVYLEGVAGNATRGRIKYGGLFLTEDSVLFIPHRFAIGPKIVDLPLERIRNVNRVGISLLKSFSGGLRGRLLLETKNGERYEFSVWEIDKWIKDINERLTPSSPSQQSS